MSYKKIHLLSAYVASPDNFGPKWLLEHSKPLQGFEIVDSPADADCIIFIENHPGHDPYFRAVFAHPVYKQYSSKCILYHDQYRTVTPIRTLSPGIEKPKFNPQSKAAFNYLARLCDNEAVYSTEETKSEREYLFSFVGTTRTHPIRNQIMALKHPRCLLIDRGEDRAWEMSQEERMQYEAEYAASITDSSFVLCPAGANPSSYRIYESMFLGRVPVIIADEMQFIEGVDWDRISVTILEKDISSIPEILESKAPCAAAMGREARQAWEKHFSPEVSLQLLCETATRLLTNPYGLKEYVWDIRHFLEPYHLRGILRYLVKQRKTSRSRWAALCQ